MRRGVSIRQLVFLVLLLIPTPAGASPRAPRHGLWAGLDMGWSALNRTSDQEPSSRTECFALAFRGGVTPLPAVRLGLELGGWLIEAENLNDGSKGEAIAQYSVITQVYPLRAHPLFLRGGLGRAVYWNNHPGASGSSGWGSTFGVGYDIPVSRRLSITPSVAYSHGRVGSVHDTFVTIENRRYRALQIVLGITYP